MLDNHIKISSANVNHKIWSYLIDLAFILATGIALFFALFYLAFVPTSSYKDNEAYIQEVLTYNDMNLDNKATFNDYEASVKKFYFQTYTNEIIEEYKYKTGETYTIEHLYNTQVLGLPIKPTIDTYFTDYFSYKMSGSNILVDEIAITKESGGPTFDRNITMIMKNGYESLFGYLNKFNKAYHDAKWDNVLTKSYAVLTASIISTLIYGLIVPIANKNRQTLGDYFMKLAVVNKGDGYYAARWKIALRPLILFAIPIAGMTFNSFYSIVILTIGPLFINLLVMILSKDNLDLIQKILRLEQAYISESLLFKNEAEEIEYINSKEFKQVQDTDYLEKLSSSKSIDISTSRSEAVSQKKTDQNK